MKEEIELGEQDEVTYAIVARLPAYALWNLLDCRDEDGVPLMTVIEWLRFIRIYLRSGSDAGGDDKGASQSALDRQGVSRKMAYDRHPGTVRQLESTTRSLDGARRSAYNDRQVQKPDPEASGRDGRRFLRGSRIS
jgi:hypothetical protein